MSQNNQENCETPSELSDALARVGQAFEDLKDLSQEMDSFLYRHIGGMVKGLDRKTDSFVLQLRDPKELYVKGRPRVLVVQILENLRSTLDYMVFHLSKLNHSSMNERIPQFVIADSESNFESQANRCLKYLSDDQRRFIEQIQPYHGNYLLDLLGRTTGKTKHRHLLSIRDNTSFDIYLAEISKQDEYQGCFVYPMEKNRAIFARPKGRPVLFLMDKWDAMKILKLMIEHTLVVLQMSYCFFQGRPFKGTISIKWAARSST